MESGGNSAIGRNVQLHVEGESRKDFVHAIALLQPMEVGNANLMDRAVLKPGNVMKILAKVSNLIIKIYL